MYRITYSNGRTETVETYAEALEVLAAADCEVIGHDGDLGNGGDRTLAWMTEEDAEDDDGARSYASIEVA